MTTLVYVHGTNGSGKSTLARAILAAAGGTTAICRERVGALGAKAIWTMTDTPRLALVGKYGNACGGVDGIQPYSDVHIVLKAIAGMQRNAFAEGLVTPGVDTCTQFASYFDKHLFIFLDTDTEDCVRNVLTRRRAAGNTKPYDPANLIRKRNSALSWYDRLTAAGLNTARLKYPVARQTVLALFGLSEPSTELLL